MGKSHWVAGGSAVLYGVPILTVLVVAFALLVPAAPRAVVGARVYGGPTEGATRLAWRVEAVEVRGRVESPALAFAELQLRARLPDGGVATWQGAFDRDGSRELLLSRAGPRLGAPVEVELSAEGKLLGRGRVELDAAAWSREAIWRGGFGGQASRGSLQLRVAPARGAFAVPFADEVLVLVLDADGRPAVADLAFSGEALEFPTGTRTRSNALGRARLRLRPTSHIAVLTVEARSETGTTGTWYGNLPVMQGALHAVGDERAAMIVSPVARERAYYALITESERLEGGTVELGAEPTGEAKGRVTLREPWRSGTWLVVSSEKGLAAPSAVGWPPTAACEQWTQGETAEPSRSLTVRDQPLLDGVTGQVLDEEQRQVRVRRVTALFVVAALSLVLALVVHRVRHAQRGLEGHLRHLSEGTTEALAGAQSRSRTLLDAIIGLLCVSLGFLLLALLLLLRVG